MSWIILLVLSFYSCAEVQENSKEQTVAKEAAESVQAGKETIPVQADTINKERVIKQIKEVANNIEGKLQQYDTIQKVVFDYSAEGSEITGYYDANRNIRKVLAKHASEYGNLIEHYYFDDGALVLVHTKNSVYDKPIFEAENTQEAAYIEDDYYFYDSTLLRWTSRYEKLREAPTLGLIQDDIKETDSNEEVIPQEGNYANREKELRQFSQEYLSGLLK